MKDDSIPKAPENAPRSPRLDALLRSGEAPALQAKQKQLILQLLHELSALPQGSALKLPLAELPDTLENIRAALNRAVSQRGLSLATSSDETFFYVWSPAPRSAAAE